MSATKVKISRLRPRRQAIDNPPLNNNGGSTCVGLLAGTAGEDVAATYTSTVSLKGSGAKLATFDIVGSAVAPAGLGFAITGGTATGSCGRCHRHRARRTLTLRHDRRGHRRSADLRSSGAGLASASRASS